MTRVRWAAVLAALGMGPVGGAAQSLTWYLPSGDSALVLLRGDTGFVDLRIANTGGVSDYVVTVFMDDARVRVRSVDSIPGSGGFFGVPTVATQPGRATISATGPGTTAFTSNVARVWFEVDSAATAGSMISVRLDSLLNQAGANAILSTYSQTPFRVCEATRTWGDVDVNRRVTSRDALITLTESVGITTSGFELQWADVDADGITSSRDALFILSQVVNLFHGTIAGDNVASGCDPLAPAPSEIAFTALNLLYVIAAGDTIANQVPLPTLNLDGSRRTSWAPDGSLIAYTTGNQIYTVSPTGSGADTLTTVCCNWSPSWSPDGTRIAFASNQGPGTHQIWLMDADGSNQYALSPDTFAIDGVHWAPDGSRIVFNAYNTGSCCNYRLWTINPDSTGLTLVNYGSTAAVNEPVFSPTSDSIVYYRSSQLYAMASTDSAATPLGGFPISPIYPWWDQVGFVFTAAPFLGVNQGFYQRATDKRLFRLTRSTAVFGLPTTVNTNLVYVDQVALNPTSLTFASSTAPPQTLTATVTNSDLTVNTGVLVSWVSRDPSIVTVDTAGNVSPVTTGGPVWVVAHVRGWRADSVQATVN